MRPLRTETPPVLRLRPNAAVFMCGRTCRQHHIAVHKLRLMVSCKLSAVCARNGRMIPPPALLTRISTRPKCSTVCSTKRFALISSARSPPKPRVRSAAPDWRAAASAASSDRSLKVTLMPSCSNRFAMHCPMPLPAPVTIATRPRGGCSAIAYNRPRLAEARIWKTAPGIEDFRARGQGTRGSPVMLWNLLHAEAVFGRHAVGVEKIEKNAGRWEMAARSKDDGYAGLL